MTEPRTGAPVLDASPTKEFFIHMLTKDIPLRRAILDLIDNSVDGARRCGATEDTGSGFAPYEITVEYNSERLLIKDNCGGIPDAARSYAFRFGRPPTATHAPGEIGQFGVGMKRTIFKVGTAFTIQSTTITSAFRVTDTRDDWLTRPQWHFAFTELPVGKTVPGTHIEISGLLPNVAEEFALANFHISFHHEIALAHALPIQHGLRILVNGTRVEADRFLLHRSGLIGPVSRSLEPLPGVTARIYAGTASRDLHQGGWYVFCNGRMLVGPDQGLLTGWGEGDGRVVPRYHADFANFRGFVFLNAADSTKLPWTTTKTGLDADSLVYRALRLDMMTMMRPVLEFLRQLERERSAVENEGSPDAPLREALQKASLTPLIDLPAQETFTYAAPAPRKPKAPMQRIQYDRPRALVTRVQKALGVSTFKEVGESTFDYYVDMECE